MKPRTAARYADHGERTVRKWLKEGLPHVRLGSGSILIGKDQLDAWLQGHTVDRSETDRVVDEVMRGL
jgi:excisionase family DNA binding protein